MRSLAFPGPPIWPWFKFRRQRQVWVEIVVCSLLCSESFFFGYSGFSLTSKAKFPNLISTRNQVDEEALSGLATGGGGGGVGGGELTLFKTKSVHFATLFKTRDFFSMTKCPVKGDILFSDSTKCNTKMGENIFI